MIVCQCMNRMSVEKNAVSCRQIYSGVKTGIIFSGDRYACSSCGNSVILLAKEAYTNNDWLSETDYEFFSGETNVEKKTE